MYHNQGFTLVELLIVGAIIALLLLVALPSYHAWLNKARRSDAIIALFDAASRQTQFYLLEQHYTDDVTALGANHDGLLLSPQGYYQLSTHTDADDHFILRATPTHNSPQQDDMPCTTISLDYVGRQEPAHCWP